MGAGARGLPVGPGATAALPSSVTAPRSRDELLPGLVLACGYAWVLAMGALIDVTEDGPAITFFGATFGVALLAASLLRPRWYLPLAAAYLPFSRTYPLAAGGVTGVNMTNFVLVCGVLALMAGRARSGPRLRWGLLEPLALAFVAVGSLSVVPAFFAGHRPLDLVLTYRAWLAPILFFFLARSLVRDRQDAAGLLRVLAWTVFLVAVCTWKEGLDRSTRGSIDAARVPGLMQGANLTGAFLAYYGVPLLAMALTARPLRRGAAYLAAFLVAARVTLYTFSRGAYLALGTGAVGVLGLASPFLLAAAGGAGALAVAVFPGVLPDSVRDRMAQTTGQPSAGEPALDRSSSVRLTIWGAGLRMVADHPVQGVGLGRFPELVDRYAATALEPSDPRDAHNAFLLMAAEMGVPSLALLGLLMAGWTLAAARLYLRRRHRLDRRIGLVFVGSQGAVLVSGMLGSRFSGEALVAYFWMLAALVVVAARWREPRRRRAA